MERRGEGAPCGLTADCHGCNYLREICTLTGDEAPCITQDKLIMGLAVTLRKTQSLCENLMDKLSIYENTSIYEAQYERINKILEETK